jgi:prepilin-type N-terminal cleavage/methylation domain-containing protein
MRFGCQSRTPLPQHPLQGDAEAFSLTEMITTISILGILASIVVLQMSDNYSTARGVLAVDRLEMLNRGMSERAASVKEYVFTRVDANTTDEQLVLMDMQYRNPDPDKAEVNSPFIEPRYRPTTSSSVNDFRLRWTGRRFELLRPGTTGSGLKVVFDGSDIGEPREYPPNYNSNGR